MRDDVGGMEIGFLTLNTGRWRLFWKVSSGRERHLSSQCEDRQLRKMALEAEIEG